MDELAGREPQWQPPSHGRPSLRERAPALTAPLLLAILALPVVFVWLLLRPGYSRDLRTGAFLYAFTFPALQLAALLLAAGGG